MTAFRVGLFAGLALGLSLLAALTTYVRSIYAPWNVSVISRGADLSRHGGARLEVKSGRGSSVTLLCRGECDDLVLRETSGDNSYDVDVLDTRGNCIRCTSLGYITGGFITKAEVSGAKQLNVRHETSIGRDAANRSVEDAPLRRPAGARP